MNNFPKFVQLTGESDIHISRLKLSSVHAYRVKIYSYWSTMRIFMILFLPDLSSPANSATFFIVPHI
jgi:hypothetical protein